MHGAAYLLNRRGHYYFRRPIPLALRSLFGKRVEFKTSLKTADKDEAKRKCEELTRDTSQQLNAAWKQLRLESRPSISKDEARRYAALYRARLLEADEAARIEGDEGTLDLMADRYGDLHNELETPGSGALRNEFMDFMREQGVDVPPKSDGLRTLLYFMRMELRQALQDVSTRAHGKDVPTPDVRQHAGMTLPKLVAQWASSKGVRPKSVAEAHSVLRRFTAQHGSLSVASIAKAHGEQYHDARSPRVSHPRPSARTWRSSVPS